MWSKSFTTTSINDYPASFHFKGFINCTSTTSCSLSSKTSNPKMTFEVGVKLTTGERFEIEVEYDETVEDLKSKIEVSTHDWWL